jgi:hypothetical protein
MKTEQMIPPLRDLPSGRLVARKEHLLAEITHGSESAWQRLPHLGVRQILSPDGVGSVFRGRRRVVIGLGLAAAISIVAVTVTLGGTARFGGAAGQKYASVSAANVNDVITQVQSGFGDGLIQSASVSGSTVTVQVKAPDRSSQALAGFEAAVLGHAIADWQAAHGQTAATDLRSLANGQDLSGMAFDVIGNDASASPLPSHTCESAAQNAPASVNVVSARTLPFAGGTCVFKLEATPANAVAAGSDIVSAMSSVLPAGTATNDYPWLVEVDDASGSPLIVSTWVPGLGGGVGAGTAYIQPGLPGADSLHM